ncbi:MAG: acyl-CoA thioesterase [Actinomycetota bacterium]|nr:acyl-CoA thioesterase [Actinomycetota bacterium]
MTADAFPFAHTLRVRYSEIDGQKVAYNSHYLTYLDVAITEYFRSLGIAFLDSSLFEVRDVFRAGLGPEVRFASMCNAVAWAVAGKKGGASVPSFTERVKVDDYGIDAEWDVECPGGDGVPGLVVAGLLHHLL